MCISFVATPVDAGYQLILAFNRDEFLDRATRPLHVWDDDPAIHGGRDLAPLPVAVAVDAATQQQQQQTTCGGTWLGINALDGRFAFITNYRERPGEARGDAASRGELVRRFLSANSSTSLRSSPTEFLQSVDTTKYNGFNLFCGRVGGELACLGNRGPDAGQISVVSPVVAAGGISISNGSFVTSQGWPKVRHGLRRFQDVVSSLEVQGNDEELLIDGLLGMLRDTTTFDEHFPVELSSICVPAKTYSIVGTTLKNYGTRSHSILLVDSGGRCRFVEIETNRLAEDGMWVPEEVRREMTFNLHHAV